MSDLPEPSAVEEAHCGHGKHRGAGRTREGYRMGADAMIDWEWCPEPSAVEEREWPLPGAGLSDADRERISAQRFPEPSAVAGRCGHWDHETVVGLRLGWTDDPAEAVPCPKPSAVPALGTPERPFVIGVDNPLDLDMSRESFTCVLPPSDYQRPEPSTVEPGALR